MADAPNLCQRQCKECMGTMAYADKDNSDLIFCIMCGHEEKLQGIIDPTQDVWG